MLFNKVSIEFFEVLFFIIPISVLTCILAPEIIRVLLGEQWDKSILPFQILTFGLVFRLLVKPFTSFMKGVGRVKTILIIQIIYCFLITGSSLIAVNIGGIELVAIGVNISIMTYCLIYFIMVVKITKISIVKIFGLMINPLKFSF